MIDNGYDNDLAERTFKQLEGFSGLGNTTGSLPSRRRR
jgi:hypothetical protein